MADDTELIGGGDPLLPEPDRRCGLTANEWVHIVAMVRRDIPRVLHLGPYRKYGITSDGWCTWSWDYLNGPVMSYILEIRKTYAKRNRVNLIWELSRILESVSVELREQVIAGTLPGYDEPDSASATSISKKLVRHSVPYRDASVNGNEAKPPKQAGKTTFTDESAGHPATQISFGDQRGKNSRKRAASETDDQSDRTTSNRREPSAGDSTGVTGRPRKHAKSISRHAVDRGEGYSLSQLKVSQPDPHTQRKDSLISEPVHERVPSAGSTMPAAVPGASIPTASAAPRHGSGRCSRPKFLLATAVIGQDCSPMLMYHYQHHQSMPTLCEFLEDLRDQHQIPERQLAHTIQVTCGQKCVNIDGIENRGFWEWEETMRMVERAGGSAEVCVTMNLA